VRLGSRKDIYPIKLKKTFSSYSTSVGKKILDHKLQVVHAVLTCDSNIVCLTLSIVENVMFLSILNCLILYMLHTDVLFKYCLLTLYD